MDYASESLKLHKKLKGKFSITSKVQIRNRDDLSLIYTPGVGAVSSYLADHKDEARDYTSKGNSVAVISDGSAVLGLGNIGPEAALPVMEGKAILFKEFANIDAIPLVLSTQDPDEIINAVAAIAPTFGGINLEDIAAPQCFYIEQQLKKRLKIPVMHDDQWGTAVVVLAGLINALKLTGKTFAESKFVMSGAGAAGMAVLKIILNQGATDILVSDSKGIIYEGRPGLNESKQEIAKLTNRQKKTGSLIDAFKGADIFIGVSHGGIVTEAMVRSMNHNSIIFALSNPIPEVMPGVAKKAGAYIVATGRSDFPNQVNNALAFPGIFRGALDNHITEINLNVLTKAAEGLASLVTHATPEKIIPSIFDPGVMQKVASAIV